MVTDIVLDVDTGVDDALALLLAAIHPRLRLRAISCVAGNTGLDQVVHNTLGVLRAAGRDDVPVARGAARPLLNEPMAARKVHGDNGLGGVGIEAPLTAPASGHAVELLRDTITGTPGGVTLVALAPLTNIALLLRTYPEVAGNINRLMVMGGSAGWGNVTATAEFNIWHDPESAAIVLNSGLPITMYGLDVFYQVAPTTDDTARLERTEIGRLAARLLETRPTDDSRLPPGTVGSLGDAGAVCALLAPNGLHTERLPVAVNLAEPARGQTIVDLRVPPGENEPPHPEIDVAVGVDGSGYVELFVETLSGSK